MNYSYILKDIRKTLDLNANDVCKGICSKSTYSKYENGTVEPNIFYLYVFFERMGISGVRFQTFVTAKDMAFIEFQENCEKQIAEKRWAELLNIYTNRDHRYNSKICRQYYYYIESYIYKYVYCDLNESKNKLFLAITQTLDCTEISEVSKMKLISISEISLCIKYIRVCLELEHLKKDVAMDLILFFSYYLFEQMSDPIAKCSTISEIVSLVQFIGIEQDDIEIIYILEKFKDQLIDMQSLNGMLELLLLLNKINSEKYKNYIAVLEKVYKNDDTILSVGFDNKYRYGRIGNVNIFLKDLRKDLGLTQEKMSEDVCSVETYARIEEGKHKPNINNWYGISCKLDIKWEYYSSGIVTENFTDILLLTDCRRYLARGEKNKAEKTLGLLKNKIDMHYIENKQTIEFLELCCKNRLDVKIDELWHILKHTCPQFPKNAFYRAIEIDILCVISSYYLNNNPNKGVEILTSILSNETRICYKKSILLLFNLSRCLVAIGEYEKAETVVKRCLKQSLLEGSALVLAQCYDVLLEINESKKIEKNSRDYCEKIYYISKLYKNEENCNLIQDYYYKMHHEKLIL